VEERRGYVYQDRLDKLTELRKRGVEPFAYRYSVSHSSTAACCLFESAEGAGKSETEPVSVAGRILSIRTHGKISFVDIADREGRLQLFLRQNELGSERYGLVELFDPGDWIGAAGPLFRTKAGEVSIRAQSLEFPPNRSGHCPLAKKKWMKVQASALSTAALRTWNTLPPALRRSRSEPGGTPCFPHEDPSGYGHASLSRCARLR
jgi:lysyl-tRNA synthetase class II